jgi:hypothetical protein
MGNSKKAIGYQRSAIRKGQGKRTSRIRERGVKGIDENNPREYAPPIGACLSPPS